MSPRHCHARARCHAPCTRAHACRARSTRTHHACATRQQCTCSHTATRAHVKKLGCRARVTGHWLPVGRLAADTSGAHTALQTRSPSPLPATMRHRHAVHAIHHRRCHRTQRHDDNERDEDERHDEEDQGHNGRRERVRAARACTAHAQRRTRKHAAREHEPGPSKTTPFKIRVCASPADGSSRSSTTRVMTCSCS